MTATVEETIEVQEGETRRRLGCHRRRVQGDLERFKEFIESSEQETGAWRGDIPRAG